MSARTDAGWRLTGRGVLYILIAFFGVVFAVNGVFVYVALRTHPGVETDNAYQKGVHYNRQIREAAQERALGWKAGFDVAGGKISVRVATAGGQPLSGLKVVLLCQRPATDREDRRLTLSEVEPGRYTAPGAVLPAGLWKLRADAVDAAGHHFRIDKSIMVRP